MNETWRERKDGWNGDGAGWWMVEARRVDEKEEKWATREYKGGGKEESMG